MNKKGILQDVVELGVAILFITIVMVSFVACQGVEKSAIEEDLRLFNTDLSGNQLMLVFLKAEVSSGYNNADLLVDSVASDDYTDLLKNMKNVFDDNYVAWRFDILDSDKNLIKTFFKKVSLPDSVDVVSEIKIPTSESYYFVRLKKIDEEGVNV